MPDKPLLLILEQCLRMEGSAILAYSRMADITQGEFREFWLDMTGQEKEHARYWSALIRLAEENKIRNGFDHPDTILGELKKAGDSAERLLGPELHAEPQPLFMIAWRLEFILLHPAFQALFISMAQSTGNRSPGDRYHEHIQDLIDAYRRFSDPDPSIDLIADMSQRLLETNEQIAEQMMEIRQLRGLLPICMHCKNVRTDEGQWVKVETYIEAHSHAEFSHGICNDCMKKYYSDYFTEEELKT